MILGSAGSGKSTLAIQLGAKLNIPVVHLDNLFWKPGWVSETEEEMDRKVIEAASKDEWIIDGNYSRTIDFRMNLADTIIYIDFNRYLCLYRVIKRRIKYHGKVRPDLAEGCKEKIDKEFLLWIWNYPKRSRMKTLDKISYHCINDDNKNAYVLISPKAVKKFLQNVDFNNHT